RRHEGPDDLELRVAVDGRAVGVVVRGGAEADDRVDHHGRDDGEDRDADRDREPGHEVDPVALVGGRMWQPREEQRNGGCDRRRERADPEQGDDGAPAHPAMSLDEMQAADPFEPYPRGPCARYSVEPLAGYEHHEKGRRHGSRSWHLP